MTKYETGMCAYLGYIHYRDGEGKDVIAQGSVFCASRAEFDASIEAHLRDMGANFLWSEEVHEGLAWFNKFGNHSLMATLARRVSEMHKVELSDPKAAIDEEPEDDSYLIIEEIEGVEPLDMQMDRMHKLTVPAALQEAIFGQPEPTAAEVEQYGENVPKMKTYAILDAAKMPYLLTGELEFSGLQYQSLFQGEAQEELKEHAPYLVELEDGNDFTRKLFTGLKPPLGLWEKELGIFIRSRAKFADIRKHFRKFTKVKDESGKWYYFRFWEGKMLKYFLKGTTQEKQTAFFAQPFQIYTRNEKENWLKVYIKNNLDNKHSGTLVISEQDFKSLRIYRHTRYFYNLKKWLYESYDPPEKIDNTDKFIQDEAQFAIDHFKTFKGEIVSNYVAASWLLGTRAIEDNRLNGHNHDSDTDLVKSLHHQAYDIKFNKKSIA